MSIPFLDFSGMHDPIRNEIIQAFADLYDSKWFILGDHLKKFEKRYAAFNQVSHCVGVSNGLDALHLSLKALGVGPGDEVIVPSNTYIATALAVSYVGAKPVFVEPDITTYNINPKKIERALTRKTKAMIPVHLYGQSCEMEAIMTIAQTHDLFVVEDNAQAHGATFMGKSTGSWGHLNATSFYPGKNLGALGDAGAITTNDEGLAEQIRLLRNYGSKVKYYHEELGFNMRLDECQAAFLTVKLKYLDQWTRQRRQIASWYDELLNGIGDLILPVTAPEAAHVYHLYVVRSEKRNFLQKHLKENGIDTLIHYPVPPHLQGAYKGLGYGIGDFPIAEELANTCLSLPIWPGLTKGQVDQVAGVLKSYF